MIPLIPYGVPMLHERSEYCPKEDIEEVSKLVMQSYKERMAAGMAAVQIGIPLNVFVAKGTVFVNIKRLWPVDRTESGKYNVSEGCFSCPGVHTVERYRKIRVRTNEGWKEYEGYMAQVIQHEFDHIKGILISDGKE